MKSGVKLGVRRTRNRISAEVAMRALRQAYPKSNVSRATTELLRDLQHFCQWKNLDFDGLLEAADVEFDNEIAKPV